MVEERVLVAIVQTPGDLSRFVESHWYRVPVEAKVTLDNHWPPQWVAAFETIKSGGETQRIRYYGRVDRIETRTREELFPGMPAGVRAGKVYYKLSFSELLALKTPLTPRRTRRNPFIHTTLRKLTHSQEFNDLFNASSYEDDLWHAFKHYGIDAEREWQVRTPAGDFSLDFAVFCRVRSLDVKVDGRPHHSVEANSISDAERDRALGSAGWGVMRFRTEEIRRRLNYCLQRISAAIEKHGGLPEFGPIVADGPRQATQMALLEDSFRYDEPPA